MRNSRTWSRSPWRSRWLHEVVGEQHGFYVNVSAAENLRFLSSSSDDLKEKVAKGIFSEDLYFRVNTLLIHLPPLRERPADIPAIADFILTQPVYEPASARAFLDQYESEYPRLDGFA